MRAALVSVSVLALVACQHDVTTSFPPGLEPIESDTAPAPAAAGGNQYPETLDLQQGNDGTDFVHATGYVDAPIEDVWAAMKDPNVVADRHHVDSFTVDPNVEQGYDVSFRTDYTIHNVVTVQFDLTWREGVVGGTESAPTSVSVVYEKTQGSSFVNMMKGSIELTQVNATTTELQFAQRMDAQNTDASNIAAWTNDLFASVVARVHAKPLP
jgi:hypothetical protein